MKFYRGVVDVGKAPIRHEIQRGYVPMTTERDGRSKQVPGAKPLDPMSAAEVTLLRHLYGAENVRELAEVSEQKNLPFSVERDRLEMIYGDKRVAQAFGPRGARAALPREIEIEPEFRARGDVMADAPEGGEAEAA